MTENTTPPKAEATNSGESQSPRQAFTNGLNERLRTLIGLQEAYQEGHIQLPPETRQAIDAEVASIKRTAEKMEKGFLKVENKLKK